MSDFPAVFDLSSLNGANGFVLNGAKEGDQSGTNVSLAGDVNGDGFDDIIIGAILTTQGGGYAGASYVVFGKANGFAASQSLSSLDGTNGFRLDGAAKDLASFVSSAGDVNGDGFDDIIVGAPRIAPNETPTGAAYVVFGKAGGFAAQSDLSSLDGTNGFRLDGARAYDTAGVSVSSAGDVNGDGFDDIIVGAPEITFGTPSENSGKKGPGTSYVVFGKADGFAAHSNLSSLNGTDGFRITGVKAEDGSGRFVSSAGDMNGDGFDDLIIGAPDSDPKGNDSGTAYVVFGKGGAFASSLSLSNLNGTNGFRLEGLSRYDNIGAAVSSAGDVNGDGFDDIIVGASGLNDSGTGGAYVVFGKAGGFTEDFNLSSLNGKNGFLLEGFEEGARAGWTLDSAGDINGDGIADLVIGTTRGESQPPLAAYVVFGKVGSFASSVDVSKLDGTNGFQISPTGGQVSWPNAVSSAGDVNGDGFDDILVGSVIVPDSSNGLDAGQTYVIFGRGLDGPVTRTGTNSYDTLAGGSFDDTLSGLNGNDVLDGLGGADRLYGGFGDDAFYVDQADDRVFEQAGEGTDTVYTQGSYVLRSGQSIESLQLNLRFKSTALDLTGNELGQELIGNAGVNRLDGRGGDDRLYGLAGDDTYVVDTAVDRVFERVGQGNDRVEARVSYALAAGQSIETLVLADPNGTDALDLTGNAFDQTLIGNAGDNRLAGRGGDDMLYGLGGDDTYLVDRASDGVFEVADAGNDRVEARVSYALTAVQSIETLALADVDGTRAHNLTGNELDQRLIGNAGDNRLDGRGGDDRLYGFEGNDTYVVDSTGDRVFEKAESGHDRVEARASYALAAGQSIESLVLADAAGTDALNLLGNELGQRLLGNAGDNILDGRGGADRLYGFGGDDTYVVDSAGDRVFETAGAGYDRIEARVSYALAAGQSIESLVLADAAGTAALNLRGNEFGQRLLGNFGDNRLDGRGGDDRLYGFGGGDTYVVDSAGDRVFETAGAGHDRVEARVSYALSAGQSIESLVLADAKGTDALNLRGNELSQRLLGNAGDNRLDGRDGDDRLYGFGGDDTYVVDTTSDRVFETAGAGHDRVEARVSYALAAGQSIESLVLADANSADALNLRGNEFSQRLLGNAGDNRLDGRGGDDRLYGFDGDDTYVVDSAGDRVFETAGSGHDRVEARVSYALAAGQSIESLVLADADGTAAMNLSGNELDQRLLGNAGDNRLDGRGGDDRLYGLEGNDTYVVDSTGDRVFETAGAGHDRVEARVSYALAAGQSIESLVLADANGTDALNLRGNELDQRLLGNAGDNILDGRGGSDTLYGFSGADTFRFTTALGAGNVDRIVDFSVSQDTIQLDRTIFSGLDLGALSASAFKNIGDPGAVVDADDRILYKQATGELFFDADGSGDQAAVLFASIQNRVAIDQSDLFVV